MAVVTVRFYVDPNQGLHAADLDHRLREISTAICRPKKPPIDRPITLKHIEEVERVADPYGQVISLTLRLSCPDHSEEEIIDEISEAAGFSLVLSERVV